MLASVHKRIFDFVKSFLFLLWAFNFYLTYAPQLFSSHNIEAVTKEREYCRNGLHAIALIFGNVVGTHYTNLREPYFKDVVGNPLKKG